MADKYLNLTGLSWFLGKVRALIPTKTSDLTNDSITGLEEYASWSTGTHNANSPELGLRWVTGSVSNLPFTSGYGFLFTTGRISADSSAPQMLLQICVKYSNSGATAFYVRYYCNGAWYAWVNVMSGSSPQYTNGDEVSY